MSSGLFDVVGLNVLITGSTKGIGAMMARAFVAAGATVFVSARSMEECARLADELGDRAIPVPADLSSQAGCVELAAAVQTTRPALDVLINNAGTTWGANLTDYPDSAWDKVLSLNLKAPFHLTVACLELLRGAAERRPPARVINIGSADGMHVPPWESYAYTSSKAGVHHLTRHLAKRLAQESITVNSIAPGYFASQMTQRAFGAEQHSAMIAATPLGRAGKAGDIAGAAIYLASPAAAWVTGAVLQVDGGMATLT